MMSVLSACVAACINPLTLPTRRSMYLTLEYKYTVFPFPLFLGDVSAGPDYFKRSFFLVPILVSNTPGSYFSSYGRQNLHLYLYNITLHTELIAEISQKKEIKDHELSDNLTGCFKSTHPSG